MKLSKKMRITAIIALAFMLVSILGVFAVERNFGQTRATNFTIPLSEVASMITANNRAYGKEVEITFNRASSAVISFTVFEPRSADGRSVPAVVTTHGGSNNKTMQMPMYVELARRGFVVIAFDYAGHGRTDNAVHAATGNSQGMTAMVELAMSMPQVNERQVGVTAHSWGNWGAVAAIEIHNTTTENNRIAAYVAQAQSAAILDLDLDMFEDGMFIGFNIPHYEEMALPWGPGGFLATRGAKSAVSVVYPGFSEDRVVEGMMYSPTGPVGMLVDDGTRQVSDGDIVFVAYSPRTTHPGFHWNPVGPQLVVMQFYAAFGVPDGARHIPSTSFVYPWASLFQLLGLIGFFAMLFPIVTMLLQTKVFAVLTKRDDEEDAPMYSIKSWKGWVPFAIIVLALMIHQFTRYFPLYSEGFGALNPAIYASSIARSLGYWSMVSGLFVMLMILLHYGMRWILHRKDGADLGNPFASVTMDSFSRFFRGIVFAFTVVGLMLIPVYIALFVFGTDFRFGFLIVRAAEPARLIVMLARFLPLFLVFYIPNAIFNANTRFREMPNWASTLICALVNCLALLIYNIYNYAPLFAGEGLRNWGFGPINVGSIVGWAVVPVLFFAAFSARFILNKTNNNAWAAGFTNALLATYIIFVPNGFGTDLIIPF